MRISEWSSDVCSSDLFDRLGRLLRPGGWLAVMTRFQSDDVPFAGWHYRRDPTHVTFYRAAPFRRIPGQRGWHCELDRKGVVEGTSVSVRVDLGCRRILKKKQKTKKTTKQIVEK